MKEGKRILIIEDDQEICKLLSVMLTTVGTDTVLAYSGTEGLLQLQTTSFDLIVLDLMLPGKSGEELIKEIREESAIPIIVISAKVDIENKVNVLKMGADDYINKPFNQKEVVARVEVQLRRSSLHKLPTTKMVWRKLTMNTEKLSVSLDQQELQLTNAEFDILSLFMRNPEQVFSKKNIYERIWKGTYFGDDNTISVHISNIRKKIAEFTSDEYIKTIWGIGFMLV